MNTEFLTNGDDDEVQPPSFTITMNASQLDAFNKAIEEELKNKYGIESSKITKDKIRETIESIMYTTKPTFSLYQFCTNVNGVVIRTDKDLKICKNPNCRNCREWSEGLFNSMKEHWDGLDAKPKSNKEYSDKMKAYLEERNKK